MNYLSVENLTKYYGEFPMFENISFGLEEGQKCALVAKNGSGKTTLLNILIGKDMPDSGEVAFNQNISIGYLEQDPKFEEGQTVIDFIFQSDLPKVKALKEYQHIVGLEDYSEEGLKKLEKATHQMEELKAWDFEARVRQVLSTFNIHDVSLKVDRLSGGQKKRVALARILIEEPNFLILDEPTNHLDLDMIEWLEEYLTRSRMTLLLVTHDRYFLDRICNEIIELSDGTIYKHRGNYSYYIENKAQREAQQAAEVDKAKNLMRKELDWVRRMPKARGTKAKYRMDAFKDLKKKAHSGKKEEKLEMSVQMNRMGKKILEIENLNKAFDDKKILEDFNYVFKRKERVGIVGKNGVGKSTFLNIVMGLESADSGELVKGETIVYGYFSQSGMQISDDKRVIDVIKEIADVIPVAGGRTLTASQFLNTFLFPPEQQYSYVSTLSGGEKRRLYLLTILMKNPNFLILDEPTNDLDLMTLSVLEDFLETFDGCLIVVSHDRYFMDKLVDHLFIFEGEGQVKDFNGKYSDYRDFLDEQEREKKRLEKEAKKVEQDKEQKQKKPQAKKLSYKERKEYEALEAEIETLETEKEEINEKLGSGEITDHEELVKLSERVGELMELIDEKMMRWMELDEIANAE
ncbi:ABC-F family ATP-binding cassette domain-containing protein [Sediminitomix flava]|uniref:ATP-binding cassette subfamily F protein uup n=1 Tax=Sediminitomix flava TaxID=379075 RepID=A0A315Z8Y5_SEDFL|nr:ABC-F family ATP-binding cassette domain-containing protein [Sediminitomix flava]PWJ42025.1 ATP-binding cassette subfamily F protein uup [Sediminitomix flava]